MKLIRIFGIVLALHVVGALLFIQPGCQSKPQSRPQARDTAPATGNLSDARDIDLAVTESETPRTSPRRPSTPAQTERSRQTEIGRASRRERVEMSALGTQSKRNKEVG